MMIRGVLIDLSGTLHVGDTLIPGAVQALDRLRQSNYRIRFLTNTSAKSSTALRAQLETMGIQMQPEEDDEDQLVTSVLATRHYLLQQQNPTNQGQLRPFCLMEDTSDLKGVPLDPPHNCVVVGLAPSQFHYASLNQAFRILLEHPDGLIAIHRANYLRDGTDGGLSLGPGGFVAALETASGCQPAKVMGKPSAEFFASALWDDLPSDQVCMIGDDVIQDIQGAANAGIGMRVLVQTGKYREGDQAKLPDGVVSATVPSIVEAVEYILDKDCHS
uniref:Haloacid dehalogenase-like hydrolase domain-containing protein 2 n=1 Tax=Amphora coffeiformis TaxID=265554 RepID=A0A7S3P8U2_9STRA|mmetsp:Transcript_12321/g.23554  ORF Transcript_12321/g.23554 Transcript_12321/m.23554 type:complete len:274 (+) Transcript_12321:371-1192(+)